MNEAVTETMESTETTESETSFSVSSSEAEFFNPLSEKESPEKTEETSETVKASVSDGNAVPELLQPSLFNAALQTAETMETVDIEPLITELVGVNEKLSVILAVAICAILWKCTTCAAKFFDMFF